MFQVPFGCGGFGAIAEMASKVGKLFVSGVFGCEGFGAITEMTFKVDFSVESKMYGIPRGNDRFHVFLQCGEQDVWISMGNC